MQKNGVNGSGKNERLLQPLAVERVEFYGDTLIGAVVEQDGRQVVYVGLKQIAQGLGIDWSHFLRKIRSHSVLSKGMAVTAIPSEGGPQEAVCYMLDMLPAALAIAAHPNRVRPEVRPKLEAYQWKVVWVLRDHFLGTRSVDLGRLEMARLEAEKFRLEVEREKARLEASWRDKEMQARLATIPLFQQYGADIAPTYRAALIGAVVGARLPVEKAWTATELAARFSGEFERRITPVMVGKAARRANVWLPEGEQESAYAFATVTKAAGCDRTVRQVVYRETAVPLIRAELSRMLAEKGRRGKVVPLAQARSES